MNNNIKKVLKKMKADTVYRIISGMDITRGLKLKNAVVVRKNLIEKKNNKYYSVGDDCNIIIRFLKPISNIEINNSSGEDILLYYSNSKALLLEDNDILKIKNQKEPNIIEFSAPVYYIKLILASESKELELDKIKINTIAQTKSKINIDNMMKKAENNNNNDKIVIVTHDMSNTGAPLLAYNMCEKFKSKGIDVAVVTLSEGKLVDKFLSLDIPIFSLNQIAGYRDIKNKQLFEDIVSKLYNLGYRKVITNTIISGMTAPTFKQYGYYIVSLIHEMYNSIVSYNMEQGGYDISAYSDIVIFPDDSVKLDFLKLFNLDEERIVVRPQGIYYSFPNTVFDNKKEMLEKLNLPVNSRIVIGIGTADLRKGIDLFIKTIIPISKFEKNYEYHFIWLGDINDIKLKKWLELELNKCGLNNRFHNIPFISDKNEYFNILSISDAFYLSSREDPFPSVMMEAASANLPVFAFLDSGGANTLLSNGRGVLVKDFDTYMMAKSIDETLNKTKELDSITNSAKDYIINNLKFDDYISFLAELFNQKFQKKYNFADLTVIVPNYNYEKYLSMRLWSIANQTIKPKKILFLDDNSTDNSVNYATTILEQIEKKFNIKYEVVENQENRGCFKQWLNGINRVKTELFWIAEADDYCSNLMIEKLLKKIKDPKVCLAYAQSTIINEFSTVSSKKYAEYTDNISIDHWEASYVNDGQDEVENYLSKKNTIPNVSACIFRKSLIKGIDSVLNQYNIIGDWAAYLYVAKNGKIAFVDTPMNYHRRHSKSIISKKENTPDFIKEYLFIQEQIITDFNIDTAFIINSLTKFYNDKKNLIVKNNEINNLYFKILKELKIQGKKENVMIIIPDMEIGGGQTVSINLANNLAKKYNIFLVNARRKQVNPIIKNMISSEVKLLDIYDDYEILKNISPSLNLKAVISFIWWSDKLSYLAFKNTDIKMIFSMHGCYEMLLHHSEIDPYFNKNIESMLNRANSIVYTAEKNKEIFDKISIQEQDKIVKIDNGFILNDFSKKDRQVLNIGNDDFVFGLVARGIPEKGYEQAIDAFNIVSKENEKCHLLLVGSSDYMSRLKFKNVNNKNIHFIDKFTEPNEWLGWEEIFDVMILPTYFASESLPTVIVESLFLEKPIISTDIGEIKSMILDENYVAGAVIDLKNGKPDIKDLAKSMSKMMNDKGFYNLCKNGTKVACNRFDMKKCVEEYSKLIDK